MIKIFEKYNIPFSKDKINKCIDEYLTNSMIEMNEEIIDKYIELLNNYEKIIQNYVEKKTNTKIIKEATSAFVNKISQKNRKNFSLNISNNLIENINSMIFVYDNRELNNEILSRINTDINEIIDEMNKSNFNFVIESINNIIKNIIKNI